MLLVFSFRHARQAQGKSHAVSLLFAMRGKRKGKTHAVSLPIAMRDRRKAKFMLLVFSFRHARQAQGIILCKQQSPLLLFPHGF